jgi:hypothetical protein
MNDLLNLPAEIIIEIGLKVDLDALMKLCTTHSTCNELLCSNEAFWKLRLEKDFGIPELYYGSYKELYETYYQVGVFDIINYNGFIDYRKLDITIAYSNVIKNRKIGSHPLINRTAVYIHFLAAQFPLISCVTNILHKMVRDDLFWEVFVKTQNPNAKKKPFESWVHYAIHNH